MPEEEQQANARLIAQAPALVMMLKVALRYLEHPDVQALPFVIPAQAQAIRARDILVAAVGSAEMEEL